MTDFRWISILSVLVGLDLCWPVPAQIETQKEFEPPVFDAPDQNADISTEFLVLELSMKLYIGDMKRGQLAPMLDDSRFLEEVDMYIAKLPLDATKIVTTKTRNECQCEGRWMSPCPTKCMYSCYLHNSNAYDTNDGWFYADDCRHMITRGCRCDESSPIDCNKGRKLDECIEETTETLPVDTSCSQYSIKREYLVENYKLIRNLLTEPLRKYLRAVESRLKSLRRASINFKNLKDRGIIQNCTEEDSTPCESQANQLVVEEKLDYVRSKRNLTLELISISNRIDATSKKVEELQELTLARINRLIKEYSCCLKTLDFTIDGYNCSDVTNVNNSYPRGGISTTTASTTFQCYDGSIVPSKFVCDHGWDCPDGSDEWNCP